MWREFDVDHRIWVDWKHHAIPMGSKGAEATIDVVLNVGDWIINYA